MWTAVGSSIDGCDVRDATIWSLRRSIGFVFDEPVLFSATIAENIAFGQPDASREAIEQAASTAGAHDFVLALDDGYDTKVGESGFSLSGGQRQRLALARALVFRPRILILDDPLSSVDVKTEAEIEANLRTILRGPDDDPHRAPLLHRGDGRPGPARRRRPDRRRGNPRRADVVVGDLPGRARRRHRRARTTASTRWKDTHDERRRRARVDSRSCGAPDAGCCSRPSPRTASGWSWPRPQCSSRRRARWPPRSSSGEASTAASSAKTATALRATIILLLVAATADYLGQRLSNRLTGRVAELSIYRLRDRLWRHVQSMSLEYFEQQKTGRIVSRATNDVQAVYELFSQAALTLVSNIMVLVGITVVLFTLDPVLALVVMSFIVPSLFLATWVFKSRSEVAYRDVRERIALVIIHMAESLTGMRVVQAFSRERFNQAQFDDVNRRHRDGERRDDHPDERVRTGCRAARPDCDVHRPAVRWAPSHGRRGDHRRPGLVPALPPTVLRPRPGAVAVLQLVPGRSGRTREGGRGAVHVVEPPGSRPPRDHVPRAAPCASTA